ncbi:MAG: hypothetical protein ACYTG6_00720, partial [Planctomycetota bacterium]
MVRPLFEPSLPPEVTVRTRLLPTLVLLAGLVAVAAPARAGWWDDLDKGETVRLVDVIAQPDRYRERILTFFCVFHERNEVFNPLATPFNPTRHENVAVWPDGVALWEMEPYKNDFPFLYIQRSHPASNELVRLEPFTRIEITGKIRAVLRGRPCIEVTGFRPTGQRLGQSVVRSVMAGDRHAERADWDLAYENYVRALQPDLPPAYDLLIRKRTGDALRRLGRLDDARRVEGGEIIGGTGMPEVAEVPGPAPSSTGSGTTLGDPLPGSPGAFPPPAVAGPTSAGTQPSSAPPPLTDDLPGVPAGPGPVTDDLPGTPLRPGPVTDDLPGRPAGATPPPDNVPPTVPAPVPGPLTGDLP